MHEKELNGCKISLNILEVASFCIHVASWEHPHTRYVWRFTQQTFLFVQIPFQEVFRSFSHPARVIHSEKGRREHQAGFGRNASHQSQHFSHRLAPGCCSTPRCWAWVNPASLACGAVTFGCLTNLYMYVYIKGCRGFPIKTKIFHR